MILQGYDIMSATGSEFEKLWLDWAGKRHFKCCYGLFAKFGAVSLLQETVRPLEGH